MPVPRAIRLPASSVACWTCAALLLLWQHILCVAAPVALGTCDDACNQRQRSALLDLYSSTGGDNWTKNTGWDTAVDYCQWQGVFCCQDTHTIAPQSSGPSQNITCPLSGSVVGLQLGVNNLVGTLSASALAGLSDSLLFLDLHGNSISGPLPASFASLQHLRLLYLHSNAFNGTLPASWSQLSNLTSLNVATNRLTGAVPAEYSDLTSLIWFTAHSNCLSGSVPVQLLTLPHIDLITLRDNCLSGPWPNPAYLTPAFDPLANQWVANMGNLVTAAEQHVIAELTLRNNSITGKIPSYLATLPVMQLDLSYNGMSGTLPEAIGVNPFLRGLNLEYNYLSGTLPDNLDSWNVKTLDLSHNNLSGSIPTSLGSANSLVEVQLSNNRLSGTLPDSFSTLSELDLLDLSYNNLSEGGVLPDWLIMDRSARQELAPDCNRDLHLLCSPLTFVGYNSRDAQVRLDPSYYSFEGCSCDASYLTQEARNGSTVSIKCIERKADPADNLKTILVPVLVVSCVLVAAAIFAYKKLSISGVIADMRASAEKKSPPGPQKEVTLVLTDVQGSTELWEWNTELAAEAFILHDALLRSYMSKFYGYEVSTEGDAFLVAFHEPFDAVAWCLTVQLALQYADWPEQLLTHKNACLETADSLLGKRQRRQQRWQKKLQKQQQERRHSADGSAAGTADDTGRAPSTAGIGSYEDSISSLTDSGPEIEAATSAVKLDGKDSAPGHHTRSKIAPNALFRGLRVRMSLATGSVDSVRVHTITQRAEYIGEVLRRVQAVAETPHGGQIVMDPETFKGINARLPELGGCVVECTQKLARHGHGPADPADMPLYTTSDVPNSMNNNHALHPTDYDPEYEARFSSNAGARRYSLDILNPLHGFNALSKRSMFNSKGSHADNGGDVEEGGSGIHYVPSNASTATATTSNPRAGTRQRRASVMVTARNLLHLGRTEPRERRQSRRRSSLSYGVMVIDMGVHELSGITNPINLVQVLPCGLEDRARFFPRLDSVRQKTPGFFDAPAAGLAPLSSKCLMPAAQPMYPETTIVFCSLEKYSEMITLNRAVAEQAVQLYSDCVRWLLLVAGGYECQEAEGTFMIAFNSADAAIEWCLMSQLVLRDINWPQSVLELPAAEEEKDLSGNIVFRGPRVKMGVYCGVPTRVVPHTTTGRADYFGQVVNRAARYCHAAARGGQVLVSKDLMLSVMASWLKVDASELGTEQVAHYTSFFDDQQRRTWPWPFMRRRSEGVPIAPTDVPEGLAFFGVNDAGNGHVRQSMDIKDMPSPRMGVLENGTHPTPEAHTDVSSPRDNDAEPMPSFCNADFVVGKPIDLQRQPSQQQQQQQQHATGPEQSWQSAANDKHVSSYHAPYPGQQASAALPVLGLSGSYEGVMQPGETAAPNSGGLLSASEPCSGAGPTHVDSNGTTAEFWSSGRAAPAPNPTNNSALNSRPASNTAVHEANPPVATAQTGQAFTDHTTGETVFGASTAAAALAAAYAGVGSGGFGVDAPVFDVAVGGPSGHNMSVFPVMESSVLEPLPAAMGTSPDETGFGSNIQIDSASDLTQGVNSVSRQQGVLGGIDGAAGVPGGVYPLQMQTIHEQQSVDSTASEDVQQALLQPPPPQQPQPPPQQQIQQLPQPLREPILHSRHGGFMAVGHPDFMWDAGWHDLYAVPWEDPAMQPFMLGYPPAGTGRNRRASQLTAVTEQQESVTSRATADDTHAAESGRRMSYMSDNGLPIAGPGSVCSDLGPLPTGSRRPSYMSEGVKSDGNRRYSYMSQADSVAYSSRRPSYMSDSQTPGPGNRRLSYMTDAPASRRPSYMYDMAPEGRRMSYMSDMLPPGARRPSYMTDSRRPSYMSDMPFPGGGRRPSYMSEALPGGGRRPSMLMSTEPYPAAFRRPSYMYVPPPDGRRPSTMSDAQYDQLLNSCCGTNSRRTSALSEPHYGLPPHPNRRTSALSDSGAVPWAAGATSAHQIGPYLDPYGAAAFQYGGGQHGELPVYMTQGRRRAHGANGPRRNTTPDGMKSKHNRHSDISTAAPLSQGGSNLTSGQNSRRVSNSSTGTVTGAGSGGLHGNSRLRLVSKRRRQMSYCFDLETSNPGTPADLQVPVPPSSLNGSAGGSLPDTLASASRQRNMPTVNPVPDASTMQSLRVAAPDKRVVEDQVSAGFSGPDTEHTCAAVIMHRWLWARELLVHDLGEFRFKGVAGTHAIVSVTSEELSGRTYPSTIRKGKGEQVKPGLGLLYMLLMVPARYQPKPAVSSQLRLAGGMYGAMAPPPAQPSSSIMYAHSHHGERMQQPPMQELQPHLAGPHPWQLQPPQQDSDVELSGASHLQQHSHLSNIQAAQHYGQLPQQYEPQHQQQLPMYEDLVLVPQSHVLPHLRGRRMRRYSDCVPVARYEGVAMMYRAKSHANLADLHEAADETQRVRQPRQRFRSQSYTLGEDRVLFAVEPPLLHPPAVSPRGGRY